MPEFYLFGGPNGAGKTTSALRMLPVLGCRHFLNADMLAQGFSPLDVDVAAFKAGMALMRELRSLASKDEDFGTESTLAARAYIPLIERWRDLGYRFHLYYVWLPNAEMAVARVAARVRAGDTTFQSKLSVAATKPDAAILSAIMLRVPISGRYSTTRPPPIKSLPRVDLHGRNKFSMLPSGRRFMSDAQLQDFQNRAIEAGREAVADAIETHRRMGRSIVVMENGQIKHIKPKDLKPRALPNDELEEKIS